MKNFGAMAMNDEELDNVVGGAKVDVSNGGNLSYARENVTPIHSFAIESNLDKLLQVCGLTQEQYNLLAVDAQRALLMQYSNMLALDNVNDLNALAHALDGKM